MSTETWNETCQTGVSESTLFKTGDGGNIPLDEFIVRTLEGLMQVERKEYLLKAPESRIRSDRPAAAPKARLQASAAAAQAPMLGSAS